MMWQTLKSKIAAWFESAKLFFQRSEVILWSRIQVAAGFFLAVFQGIDWSTVTVDLQNAKHSLQLAAGLILNGIFTEYLRRRNADLPIAPKTS
jgi:hypothetical protein